MTIKQVKTEIEELADRIDEYLGELEKNGKDSGNKYETLLYIAGGLRELLDAEL